MVTENQLVQAFDNVKPHLLAIMQALGAYGIPETTVNFYKGCIEIVTFDSLGQDYTLTHTPAVEERTEISRGRGVK